MAFSRYRNESLVEPQLPAGKTERTRLEREGMSTFASYPEYLFEKEVKLYHTLQAGDRLDQLARKYFNEGRYWWIICMVNGIVNPLSDNKLKPGSSLKIVLNPRRIFQIMSAYNARG